MPPQDVYAKLLLLSAGRGYPLWIPEPSNELLMERPEGLAIGDVGVILEDGGFDVLFNICLPPDHPFHIRHGVPQGFTCIHPGELDIRTIRDAEPPGHVISTSSITRETFGSSSDVRHDANALPYRFNLSSNEGALLVLPKGAEKCDLLNKDLFLEQASRHAAEWYHYTVNRRRRIINPDSLYLITGIHKTLAWSVAAFQNASGNENHTAYFKRIEGNSYPLMYSWETTTCALDWRVVSDTGPHIEYGIPNQAVFIRGFKIAIRSGLFGTRWVSVEADTPSTRPNRVTLSSVVTSNSSILGGLAGFLDIFPSSGSTYFPTTTRSEGTIDADEERPQSNISNRGGDGMHFEIQGVPDAPLPFHPSDAINRYLLDKDSSANIAITHDSHWISLFEDGSLTLEELGHESSLETLLSQNYHIASREGVAYLETKSSQLTESRSPFTPEQQVSTTTFPQSSSSRPHLLAEDADPPLKQGDEEISVHVEVLDDDDDDDDDGGFDHFFSYPFPLPTRQSPYGFGTATQYSGSEPSEGAPIQSGASLNIGGSGPTGHQNIGSIEPTVRDPELKEYICNWTIDGQSCGTPVFGRDFTVHLRDVHRVHGSMMEGFQCRWDDCGDIIMSRASLLRHVREKHLAYRWVCETCNAEFSRKTTMYAHSTLCHGN